MTNYSTCQFYFVNTTFVFESYLKSLEMVCSGVKLFSNIVRLPGFKEALVQSLMGELRQWRENSNKRFYSFVLAPSTSNFDAVVDIFPAFSIARRTRLTK